MPSPVQVIFLVLSVLAVGSALLVVTTRNLVHAALWLVVTLGSVAGVYLVLAAEFVAWVQVLIYVGAVVVLLLFALMLTKAPTGPQPDLTVARALPAAVVAALVAVLLCVTVVAGFRDVRLERDQLAVGTAEVTGSTIFSQWVLPFEVLSVLLLAALVGAIVLSRLRSGLDEELEGLDRLDHPGTALRGTGAPDAAVVAAGAGEPAVRDRGVRRARPPQRGAGADGRGADAQRGQHQPGGVRRVLPRRAARRADPGAVHDRDRRRGDRARAGDRAAGVPHPRAHRGGTAA